MNSSRRLNNSVFALLQSNLGDRLPVVRATKSTLIHLSHALENIVLTDSLPGLIFAGFQKSSYWMQETARYRELAKVAQQICIFADNSLPPESEASELHIQLSEGDPLHQEWFLLILTEEFTTLLCGLDGNISTSKEAFREFDTLWTFDSSVIEPVLDMLEHVVNHYRPDRLETLRATRRQFSPPAPNVSIISRLTLDLIRFEERLHQQLRWQTDITNTLMSSITHYLYVAQIDTSGNIQMVFLSPNFSKLVGYPVGEIQSDWDFWTKQIVHSHDRHYVDQIFYDRFEHAQGTEDQFVLEYRLVRRDGHTIWVSDSVRITHDTEQGIRTLFGVIEDITSRREAEKSRREQERLRLELEQQQQLNAFKNYFMSSLSHEFRTPLSTVLSSSELLERYADRMESEERHRKLKTIKGQVLHLRRMLDDITFILNDEVENLGFRPEPLMLRDHIGEIVIQLQISDGASHNVDYHYDGPDAPVTLDPVLLKHILVNLASNAFKYSPGGTTVHIHVNVTETNTTLDILDHGFGIRSEDQPHIFELLQRGRNVSHISGLGLGLKIVRDCVERHGGKITFTSEQNIGTRFRVTLPTSVIQDSD